MFNIPWKTLLISGILLLFGGLLLKRCDNHKYREITDEKLKPTEKTAIIINDRGEVTTINRGNSKGNGVRPSSLRRWNPQSSPVSTEVIKRTDGAKDIRISIDSRGNVSYTFRTWGFQFSPEAGTCYASSSHTGIAINNSFFFYRKHGALIGLRFALSGGKDIKPYIAYTYNPQWKYINNTSVVLGIDLDKQFILGTSTHF